MVKMFWKKNLMICIQKWKKEGDFLSVNDLSSFLNEQEYYYGIIVIESNLKSRRLAEKALEKLDLEKKRKEAKLNKINKKLRRAEKEKLKNKLKTKQTKKH